MLISHAVNWPLFSRAFEWSHSANTFAQNTQLMEWTNSVDLNSVQFYIQNIYGNFNWLFLTFLKDTSYDNHRMKTAPNCFSSQRVSTPRIQYVGPNNAGSCSPIMLGAGLLESLVYCLIKLITVGQSFIPLLLRTGWSQPTWRCICQWPTIARLHATPNCWVGTLRRPTIGDLSATARVPRLRQQNSRQILWDRFGETRSYRR